VSAHRQRRFALHRRAPFTAVTLALGGLWACATSGTQFPWPAQGPGTPAAREDVVTVNKDYDRSTSEVLVRQVKHPTRAALDYAAYRANFMNADPPPEGPAAHDAGVPHAERPFHEALVAESLTGSLARTPLTAAERGHALALAPLVELLASKHVAGADRLEDVMANVRAETWGLAGGPQVVRQTATLGFLHSTGPDKPPELWVEVEFAPWFKGFSGMPDDDGDGFPNVYGRASAQVLGDTTALASFIRDEYEGKVLSPTEVKGWAHQLASYWYPSYNTDLVPGPGGWPAADTEPSVKKQLGSLHWDAPTVVMRGKPQGKPVYNVFLIDEPAASPGTPAPSTPPAAAALKLPPSKPSPAPQAVTDAVKTELAAHGGSWTAWSSEVAPLHAALKARLAAMPAGSKALAGSDGFLFFNRSISYLLGGDLAKQKKDRNPIPTIVAFRKLLAKHGVDLLFVPVPTKAEVFPDRAASRPGKDAGLGKFAGKVANPFERKFLLDLAAQGVETVDLLPALLATRADDKAPAYQAQDTHWTTRGLELAAKLVAERIRHYPWYTHLAAHKRAYHQQEASFSRHGDLLSRLPENERAGYQPETLVGHQVLDAAGNLYDDDPDSPVVLLGDSFTGVYQLMDCEHAGVSAHLAKELGYPLDLVMSYGGGPNVRQKLMRRGESALSTKKLVIWMMTARDLYDFEEGWEPLGKTK